MTPTVLIAQLTLDCILADARRFAGKKERGGILLGLRRGPHLHVNEATLPMRWDFGTLFSFHRSAAGHQEIALRRWRQSRRTVDWVGEWHSHPETIPSPSSIDRANWRRICNQRGVPMAFVIVGYEELWVGILAPGADRPVKLVEAERSIEGVAFAAMPDATAIPSAS